jgi:hypothetical protein
LGKCYIFHCVGKQRGGKEGSGGKKPWDITGSTRPSVRDQGFLKAVKKGIFSVVNVGLSMDGLKRIITTLTINIHTEPFKRNPNQ